MVDGQVGDHSFQIALRPRRQRGQYDGAGKETEQPWAEDFDLFREERKQQTHKAVNAHFREHAGKHHRDASRRSFVCVWQPGMERKQRHFHGESKKNSGKGEPSELACEEAASSKPPPSCETTYT